jgi:DNA-binding XRE family transcriptional regulator
MAVGVKEQVIRLVETLPEDVTVDDIMKEQVDKGLKELDEGKGIPHEEMVNIFDTGWYKETSAATTPGDALKIYRENAGFTQEELGRKLGKCARQKISDIERGKRNISKEMAKKISRIFNVPVDRFL